MCLIRDWLRWTVVAIILLLAGCGPAPIKQLLVIAGLDSPYFEDAVTGYTGSAGSSSLDIGVPPGVSGNSDLLVAVLAIQANPNTAGPDGWTGVPGYMGFNGATCQPDGQGVACQLAVFYKVADGSETSAMFSWGSTRRAAGAILRFSNIDTNSPVGVTRSQRGTSDTPTAAMVTTTGDGSRVLRIVAAELDEARPFLSRSLALTDEPSSARLNILSFPDAVTDPINGCGPPLLECDATETAVTLAISDTRHSTVGASGPVSWELPGADQWVTASIELKRAQ